MQLQLAQATAGHGSTVVLQTVDWDLTAMELVYVVSESVIILSFSVLVLSILVASWTLSVCRVANKWIGYMMAGLLLVFVFDRALLLMLGGWEASAGLTYWKAFLAVLCVGAISLVLWWTNVNMFKPVKGLVRELSVGEFESELDHLQSRLIKATQTRNVCQTVCDLAEGGSCPVGSIRSVKEAADICKEHQIQVSSEAAVTFQEIKQLARSVRQKLEQDPVKVEQILELENKPEPDPS